MNSVDELSEIFKVFGDSTRLKILKMLINRKYMCVNAITHNLNIRQSAVSQHLKIMRQIGLLKSERKGYHIHYSINHDFFKKYKKLISKHLGEELL